MKVARYLGGGQIAIEDEPRPSCPEGGLLVQTLTSGLCSGELMDWYMDAKIPHVLGHEACGLVVESDDERYPLGSRVAPHHHASCGRCPACSQGREVFCPQWKATRLNPGGMAEYFAVSAQNLDDCPLIEDLDSRSAALAEPLACVVKSIRRAGEFGSCAVVGLGAMGLMHALMLPQSVGYDLSEGRREWALKQGVDARAPGGGQYDAVFVCPGSEEAIRFGASLTREDGTLLLFSPVGPPGTATLPLNDLYFRDIRVVSSYSCGASDIREAIQTIEAGRVRAEQVVSDFITLDQLPDAYQAMKRGEILKAMVEFP